MESERSTDKLARYTLAAATILVAAGLFWYFRSVLVYIIRACIVSLIGLPLMRLMRKVKIKGKSAPDAVLAVVSIVLIMGLLGLSTFESIIKYRKYRMGAHRRERKKDKSARCHMPCSRRM